MPGARHWYGPMDARRALRSQRQELEPVRRTSTKPAAVLLECFAAGATLQTGMTCETTIKGENLAAWHEAQGHTVHRAAGVVWWEAERGVLEPVAPVAAGDFTMERPNIELLLKLTGKREARFASRNGDAGPVLWSVWHRRESHCRPTADVVPIAAWQLRTTGAAEFVDLVGRHAAWHAVGRFTDDQQIDSYMITCEDSGWMHEVECSHPDDSRGEELRRYWQNRIRHSEEWLGLIHRPSRHGFANTNLRWSKVGRPGHLLLRAFRAMAG